VTPGRFVLDASVAAKLFFIEDASERAVDAVRAADWLIAPDLLFLEMASIAAKNVRRATASQEQAARAVHSLSALLDETIGAPELAPRAFELAAAHGFSAYDAAYLALAEARGFGLLTADTGLVRLAWQVGMAGLVQPIS
jgi:predicted nucleic acid-binding protein